MKHWSLTLFWGLHFKALISLVVVLLLFEFDCNTNYTKQGINYIFKHIQNESYISPEIRIIN